MRSVLIMFLNPFQSFLNFKLFAGTFCLTGSVLVVLVFGMCFFLSEAGSSSSNLLMFSETGSALITSVLSFLVFLLAYWVNI